MLAAALAAAGCAPRALVDDGLDYAQRHARLAAMTHWEIDGRVAIDTGERAFQGRFQWRQSGGHMTLTVRGPFGAGGVRIAGTLRDLTIAARGETRQLTDPEQQLSQLLGWWLPVGSLDSWLRGIPDGAYPAKISRGRYGTLTSLTQRRWRLDFSDYMLASGALMPGKIAMSHGPLKIKVKVDGFSPSRTAGGRLN